MFRFLKFMYNLFIFGGLVALLVFLIVDPTIISDLISLIKENFDNSFYQLIAIIVLSLYFISIVLSYIERATSKKKKVSVSLKKSKIEFNFVTLEKIIKIYLEEQNIIKSVKVKIVATSSNPILDIELECYRIDELSEKLIELEKDLEEYMYEMVGVKPKNIIMKIVKMDLNFITNKLVTEEIKEEEAK